MGRRLAVDHRDQAAVILVIDLEVIDDTFLIEGDGEDTLIDHVGFEKARLLRLLGDVIPGVLPERAFGRRRTEQLLDTVLVVEARLDLNDLFFVRHVAMLKDLGRAGGRRQARCQDCEADMGADGPEFGMPGRHGVCDPTPQDFPSCLPDGLAFQVQCQSG